MQLTLRTEERELERSIRDLAQRERISLNQAVLQLARRGAGLDEPTGAAARIGSRLDRFAGTWSKEEAREFNKAVRIFDRIDQEIWA